MKRSRTVREGIAYLLEDVMQKSEVVLAAQSIVDKLQDIAEDLSTLEAKEIMPLYDSLTNAFGPQVADQFNSSATDQIRQVITAIQAAKAAIDQEIQRMKQGVEGGDMSDMAMGDVAPPPGDMPDDMAPPNAASPPNTNALPEVPAAPPEEPETVGGGFAGRPRKESVKPRGKKITEHQVDEDFLGKNDRVGRSAPAIDQHPHKSVDFPTNLHNLAIFHGPSGKLARNIEGMIDSEPLTGEERTALANVLSHFAGFAQEPSHWANAEAKLKMTLQTAGLWDTSKPAVDKIVMELRKLAHLIAFKHEGLIESAIKQLKGSSDPDNMVFQMFRGQLSETRDAQTAAIRTARTFAIDIEDVVNIVHEAAKKSTSVPDKHQKKIALSTLKMHDAGAHIMGGMTKAEARKFLKDKCGYSDAQIKKLDEDVEEKECQQCHGTGKVFPNSNFGREKKCVKCNGTGKIKEPMDTPDSAKGMFKGVSTAELKKKASGLKDQIENADEKGKEHARLTKELRRVEFAIRAHKSKGGKGWHHSVNEDSPNLLQNTPMFPVQTGANAGAAPNPPISNPGPGNQSTPPVGGPNVNSSTNKAVTPADMRARQQAQAANDQTKVTQTGGQTMIPPTENGNAPPSTQTQMAPTNAVKKPAFFQQRQQ